MRGLNANCLSCDLHAGNRMTDSSVFSCLPNAVRDSILQQAFQQLDQRHMFGVAPRVCRLWHQVSLSISTSLDVRIRTAEAAEQLSLWISNHPTALKSLELNMAYADCNTEDVQPLLQSVGAADQLCSLSLFSPQTYHPLLDLSLTMLTKLTSLRIVCCGYNEATLPYSIPHLTTLKSLSLSHMHSTAWQPFMQQISACLVQLTSLNLRSLWDIEAIDIAVLCALPQLQQLQLDCKLPAKSLSKLGTLPVTAISISMCEGDTEADLTSWLRQSAADLRELALHSGYGSNHIATPSLVPLQQALQLRDLLVLGVQLKMTEVGALTQLTKLVLDSCELDDRAVCTMSALSGLRVLSLCGALAQVCTFNRQMRVILVPWST